MLTIVRKSDNQPCGTIPSNMTADQEILLNAIPNFGGSVEDYEVVEMGIPLPDLPETQQQKIIELNTACNQAILSGFQSSCTGVEHQYKFDMEYQGNFAQQGVMLTLDPTIEVVPWPTSDAGVIAHTREQFIQLCKEAQAWKGANIYRYFGLKSQVETCTEIADVEAFAW